MSLLTLVRFGCLSPHLAHVLQNHVHVPVEGLHSAQDLAVVAAVHKDLRVSLHCLGQQREWSLVECVLLRYMLLFLSHYNSYFIIINAIKFK